jgi:hypothetical protein
MDKKIVREAVAPAAIPTLAENTHRAIELLIAKDGVFRTDESWVYAALQPLIKSGHVDVDGTTISIGKDFEPFLLGMADRASIYNTTLKNYRQLVASNAEKYDVTNFDVMDKVASIHNTDEKIVYLTSVLAETFGKLEEALNRTSYLENLCKEMDISLSVMESMTFDESSDS